MSVSVHPSNPRPPCLIPRGCIYPLSARISASPASTVTTGEHSDDFMQFTHLCLSLSHCTLDVNCLIFLIILEGCADQCIGLLITVTQSVSAVSAEEKEIDVLLSLTQMMEDLIINEEEIH